jgi:pimeloyl-ACP methyl ester carboxylesterase
VGTIVKELNAIAGFDVPPKTSYDGDVFIIHGGQSRFVRHAYMDQIAEFFPNHMLTTIRGAGHWVHAEAPDDTIALLKRYLDR